MTEQLRIHNEIYEHLLALLNDSGNDLNKIQGTLDSLEAQYDSSVYSHIIYILCHLFFETDDAKQHWKNITRYRHELTDRLGHEVDFRVAMLSYFIDTKKEIKNPKIIEIRLFQQTQVEAFTDQLTGLYNYRYFMNRLSQEVKNVSRYESTLSLIMFDVDDFKLYNDCYGHLKGNEVLLQIAKVLLSCVREVDVVARYGGEEFAVLLPNTHKQGAYILGERIRKSVENRNFRIKDNRLLDKNLTLSGGIATYFIDAKDDQELIEKSDKALYVAKSRGKNNVTLYSTEKREHRRLTVSLGGIYTLPSSDRKSLQTVDVSVGGLSFLTTEDVPVDSIIGITLDMPVERGAGREIQLIGKVVRVKRVDDHNEVGIKIIEIEQKYKVDLMNYIKLLEPQERAHSP